jgi:EAL and modified HD-GYP domain-containing signal transduction protein
MGSQAAARGEQSLASVARHPILDADEQVLGYELSFLHDSNANGLPVDAESQTCAIIETLNVMGLAVLCDGRYGFIDCTHQMLLKEYLELLPPDVVIEIQQFLPADEAPADACQRLKHAGYMIALDDFRPADARESLVQYSDFIKVDIKKVSSEDCAALVRRYASPRCRMLAQNVETREDFAAAKRAGFTQFQGYFFRHAEHLRARHIPASKTTYLRLLQAISKSELDLGEIENLVKHEPSLCYRLLRYLNSPLLGMSSEVLSIRHGFNVLGERELVRWIRMACTLAMGQDKSSDLALASLVRARFCELIAPKVKHGQTELFLMGMLSLMSAILEVPIGIVLEGLPLDSVIKAQLLCGKTGNKTPLSPLYDLMVAREAGDWGAVTKLSKELNLSLVFVAASYNEAMRWAHQVTNPTTPQLPEKS